MQRALIQLHTFKRWDTETHTKYKAASGRLFFCLQMRDRSGSHRRALPRQRESDARGLPLPRTQPLGKRRGPEQRSAPEGRSGFPYRTRLPGARIENTALSEIIPRHRSAERQPPRRGRDRESGQPRERTGSSSEACRHSARILRTASQRSGRHAVIRRANLQK